ncbi:MAG: DUF6132 family protein [Bacteroidales bacterium]
MKILKKYSAQLVGAIIGIVGGYFYYRFIGCNSGSCPITSNPFMSMIWGGLMSYLLVDMVVGFKKSKKEPKQS